MAMVVSICDCIAIAGHPMENMLKFDSIFAAPSHWSFQSIPKSWFILMGYTDRLSMTSLIMLTRDYLETIQ